MVGLVSDDVQSRSVPANSPSLSLGLCIFLDYSEIKDSSLIGLRLEDAEHYFRSI